MSQPTTPAAYRRNRSTAAAFEQATMLLLRTTPGYEPAIYGGPDAPLAPGAAYDGYISLPAGAWIVGCATSSQQPEGFYAQVTLPAGGNLFNQPMTSQSLKAHPFFILPRPVGIPDAAAVKIRVINRSGSANSCQLVLWVIQPS